MTSTALRGGTRPATPRGTTAACLVVWLGVIPVAVPAKSTAAQRRDKYAPLILSIPTGTRATGLAGASVALRDVESVFANPALAGTAPGTAVGAARFADAASLVSVASSMSLGPVHVAIGAQMLDFGVRALRVPVSSGVLTEDGPGAGASSSASFALATVFRRYRWGAAVKYVEERLAGIRAGTPAVDLGVSRDGGPTNLALAVQNIGAAIDTRSSAARLPLRASLGMAGFGRPMGPLDFGASFAVTVRRDGYVSGGAGAEWSYTPLEGSTLVLRTGVRRPELREQRPVTGGASFSQDRFTLDYAVEGLRGAVAHRLAVRVR